MHLPGEGLRLEMLNTLADTYDDYSAYAYEARLEQPDALEARADILADITRDGSEPPCALGAGTVVDASMTTTEVGTAGPTNPTGLAYSGSTLYLVDTGTDSLYTVNTTTGEATLVGSLGTGDPWGLADISGTLYLVDDGTDSLYTVNTTTGAATLVGSLGIGSRLPRGLAYSGSTLYLGTASGFPSLYMVNTTTGAATWVGNLVISQGPSHVIPGGLAAISGTLYLVSYSTGNLYTVTTLNGSSSLVGSLGITNGAPRGLAYSGSTLYLVDDTQDSLYTVNTSTGAATLAGSLGLVYPTGLAVISSTLYGVDSQGGDLYTVNTSTGAATRVGSLGITNGTPRGLAYSGSTLYLVDATSDSLYTVNTTTGAATLVGSLGIGDPWGLAAISGTLYLVSYSTDNLYTVNTTTGAATLVGALGLAITPRDLAAIDSTLYLVDGSQDTLYTVNTSTGAATLFGSLRVGSISPIGLAAEGSTLYMTDDEAGLYSISVSITTSTTLDSLIDNAVLETGDTVRVRACTVDYSSTPLGLAATDSTLYVVSQTVGPDYLYTVSTTTGAATRVGALGIDNPGGLAVVSGALYLVDAGTDSLYTVNTTTGAATLVGALGTGDPGGLAVIGTTLYLVDTGTGSLYTVNTSTGAATLVGSFGITNGAPRGLGVVSGTLYLVDDGTDSLYTVNTTTGAATLVGSLGIGDPGDLAAIGSILYLVSYSTDNFYTVNTATGAATLVGSLRISSSTLGELNLSDGILGQITLAIYRTVTGGDDTLVHERTLTVYANDLVLTRPVAAWEINRSSHDEDNDASFRVPVEWRYLPGEAYEVPERARFLAWVANPPGIRTYVAPAPVETTEEIGAACVESAPPLVVENAVILKLGTGGTGPYSLEVCDFRYNASSSASVGLYYMRGDLYETNLIKKYVFLIPNDGPRLRATPGANVQSSIGSFGTPTPQPTPSRARLGGNNYTGTRPTIIDADVEADDADPRVLDVTIYWEPLPVVNGYMVRIDGVEQQDKAFSTEYRSEGFHLQEGENQRTVTFAIRGFKNGDLEGFTSDEGIFIPAHEIYYSPWSRNFRVSLTEGGSGLDLGLTDDETAAGASVDLTARDIPKAGLITDAQDNVRALFSDITGLDTDSTAAKGLLPLMALVLGIAPALAIMLSMGFSPVSLMTGIGMFTLVWGVGGPLFLGVPIAMAAIFPILMLLAGFGVLKTKGVV